MTGPHLMPVTTEGRDTLQAVAEETDEAVREVMARLATKHPGKGGAVVTGTLAAAVRFQVNAMGPHIQAFQIGEALNPTIMRIAMSLVAARDKAAREAEEADKGGGAA